MIIFLDVILLENFIVNMFLLYVTSQTVKVRVKLKYIILAAIIGSSYVVTMIYPSLKFLTKIYFKFLIAALMIGIILRTKDILMFLKSFMILILYSMLLAGVCVFIQYNELGGLDFSGVIYNFSYKKLLIAVMIMYMSIFRLVEYAKDRKELTSLIYDVDIVFYENQTTVKAFLDTGNELREPATNLPVIIVEKEVIKNINIDKYDKFYIPYTVIGGYNNKLQGIKPKYIKIHQGNKEICRDVIIAFCENKLSSLDEYRALLSRGVI